MDNNRYSAIFGAYVTGSVPVTGDTLIFDSHNKFSYGTISNVLDSIYDYASTTASIIISSSYVSDDSTMSGSLREVAPSQKAVIDYVSSSLSTNKITLTYLTSSNAVGIAEFFIV